MAITEKTPAERKKLTDLGIKALPPAPEGQRYIRWDGLLENFGVRVSDAGGKTYVVMRRVNGELKMVKVEKVGVVDLAKARDLARDMLIDMGKGVDPVEQRRAKAAAAQSDERTFKARYETFKKRHIAGLRPRSQKEAERPFDRHFLPKWKDRDLAGITRQEIADLLEKMLTDLEGKGRKKQAAKVGPREPEVRGVAVNRARTALTTFFNFAVDRGWVATNPVPRKNFVVEKSRERVLTDDELARIWHAAGKFDGPYGQMVRLVMLTAARRTEAAEARWPEIEGAIWTLPPERTKSKREHVVPLSSLARDVPAGVKRFEKCDYVFTTAGRGPIEGFSKWQVALNELAAGIGPHGKDLAEPAPLAPWGLHDLRRTCATWIEARYPLGVLKAVLNHAKGGGVTDVYARNAFLPEKTEALERWAMHIAGITSPPAGNVVRMRETA